MPDNFDPYETWFGIPANEQPPNHYRLLGLNDFETSPVAIRQAGESRIQFLQDVSTGKYVSQAQALLNQVASALVCLTNAQKKAAYDAQLKQTMLPDSQAAPVSGEVHVDTSPKRRPPGPAGKAPGNSQKPRKPQGRVGKPVASRSKPKKPIQRGKKKASFPIWGYFVTLPILVAATVGALMVINNKSKIQAKGNSKSKVEFNEEWESGVTVSEDFSGGAESDRGLSSPLGDWKFGDGVVINQSKEPGSSYLHFVGGAGRMATLELSDQADRKGILTIDLRRWSSRVNATLDVQQSSDGQSWKRLSEADYSDRAPSGRFSGQPWVMVLELSDPSIKYLRLRCDSREYANKKDGGLLIESLMIKPSLH